MTLLFLWDKKKPPWVTLAHPLPTTLFVRAGNITRKCGQPEAAEILKKLESELHYKLDSNKDELTELAEVS